MDCIGSHEAPDALWGAAEIGGAIGKAARATAVAPAIERFGEFAITNFPNSAAAPLVPTTGAARCA
jgi:hypothetical protein